MSPDLEEVVDEPHQPESHRSEDQGEPRGAECDPGGDRGPRREVGDDEGPEHHDPAHRRRAHLLEVCVRAVLAGR